MITINKKSLVAVSHFLIDDNDNNNVRTSGNICNGIDISVSKGRSNVSDGFGDGHSTIGNNS